MVNVTGMLDVYDYYSQPHRYYHNEHHIRDMLNLAHKRYSDLTEEDMKLLEYAIKYHDVIYDPRRQDNEIRSVEVMRANCKHSLTDTERDRVADLIMATVPASYTDGRNSTMIEAIRYVDCSTLYHDDLPKMIYNFHRLMKEFQFCDYIDFIKGHLDFFRAFAKVLRVDPTVQEYYIQYVESYKPRIAVFALSANPFHIGHMSVLEQAERVFDKVIIAHPNEGYDPLVRAEDILPFHQVVGFNGLLTDFIEYLQN